ncbi:MAG: SDR family NAD(P)-dependent oxidoreductase [Pirellulaceae bacterium]
MAENFWNGRRIVLTGGTRGLGLELLRKLAVRNARVLVVARDSDRWSEIQKEFAGTQVQFLSADVSNEQACNVIVQTAMDSFGGIDWLINTVGISGRVAMRDASAEIYSRFMQANFQTAVNCTHACLKELIKSNGGVINIASLAAKTPWNWMAPYVTSKAALAAFTDQLRWEIKELSTVLLVCPGPIRREDAGNRYDQQVAGGSEVARQPGAGAKIKGLDPTRLAEQILVAAARGKRELILPTKVKWLFRVSALAPSLGDWLRGKFSKD